jgi:hypothetical protein
VTDRHSSTTPATALAHDRGVRFALAVSALIATLFVATAAPLEVDETAYLAVLVAGLASVGLPLLVTAGVGSVCWALVTGFVVHDHGVLTMNEADLGRFAVSVLGTVALATFVHRVAAVIRENAHAETHA